MRSQRWRGEKTEGKKFKEDTGVSSVTVAERSKKVKTRKFPLDLAEVPW